MAGNSDVFVTFGGDTGALEAAVSVVKAQMNALTRELKTVASEFTKTGAAAESELGQKLKGLGAQMAAAKGHLSGLQSGAKAGGDAIKQMGEKIGYAAYEYGPWSGTHVQLAQMLGVGLATGARDASLAVTALGVGFGVAAAAAAVSLAVVGAQVQGLRNLDDAARAAKISMIALQNLGTAAASVGVDAEQMNQEMAGFAQKLREAQVAGGDLADFLQKNNIAIKDAHGNLLPVQQIFGKIADLVLSSNNEMDRLAALSKAGFSPEMLRLFERQTDAVKAFASSAKTAQDDVLKRGLADGEALSGAWHSAWTDIKDVALSASVSVLGSIGEIEHQGAAKFTELANEAKAAFDRITGDAAGAAAAIKKAFDAQRNEVLRREAMAVSSGKSPFGALDVNAFGPQNQAAAPSDKPTIQGLYDKKDKPAAKTDRDAENAEMKGYEDSIKAAQTAEKAKETLYAEGAKLHIVSDEQKLAATKAAIDEEYNAEKALLSKELQIDGLKLAQKQAINDKLKALEIKHNSDNEKALMQSTERQVQTWDKMVDSMSSSMSSGIMQMIDGQKKFSQVLGSMVNSLLQQFVKMGVDMVADWAKKQIALVVLSQTAEGQKTAAALTGATAREGIGAGEAASGLGAIIASAIKSITVSAGEAGAGVTAFLAPIMGPAAVGAGAATQGAVLSMAAFDVGAWNISKDQVAMVHGGETIMPAAESAAFRSMLSNAANGASASPAAASGDTHVHVHMPQAYDGASVQKFFNTHASKLAKALNQAVKNGDHYGLSHLGAR